MNRPLYGVLLITILFTLACGGKKKKSMAGDDKVNMEEFMAAYPKLTLPFSYSDSSFPGKENDSLLIAPVVFSQFVPDSLTTEVFGKNGRPKFYPVGTIEAGNGDFYLLSRGITNTQKSLLLTAYDKEKKFIAGLPVMRITKNTDVSITVTIDPRLNISKSVRQQLPNGIEITGNDVYVFNKAARKFILIMTDSLGDGATDLMNPIDTLARKEKYSGDYGEGKMNLIAIRDSKREGRFYFFIHLEKNNKECIGELKGEARFTSPTTAEYRQGGDPCVLKFIFEDNNVSLQEVEGCGSRMGALQCSFNGTYPKKKEKKKEPQSEQIVSKAKKTK
ncbi:hypothetical protein [Niabella soli]|uniref:Lipoprotein n=1 Tax=Niabella soli DSM 19437 TaxID=929713 RepID=W0F6H2_9BACT|nr:hypothetical protein [Niabella soli]AHF17408.1 hypothetical protein NIASO_06995 [Niabella soli DSM 19437]